MSSECSRGTVLGTARLLPALLACFAIPATAPAGTIDEDRSGSVPGEVEGVDETAVRAPAMDRAVEFLRTNHATRLKAHSLRGMSARSAPVPAPQEPQISFSELESPAWREAIRQASQHPAFQSGNGRLSLMRVMLEGVPPQNGDAKTAEDAPADPARRIVDGVTLFIPGGTQADRAERPADPEPSLRWKRYEIQVTSTKVLSFDDFPNGGGAFREVRSGDFVLVEHINSSRRKDNRDPVRIAGFTHAHAALDVEVPPKGQLGIVGDVTLKSLLPQAMGRIVAVVDLEAPETVNWNEMRIGPVAVGGSYGRSYEFTSHGVTGTSPLAPGTYEVLLPDFDMIESRWTVTVRPGQTTYLEFVATSSTNVRLRGQHTLSPSAQSPR
jgi:hypothetical protein